MAERRRGSVDTTDIRSWIDGGGCRVVTLLDDDWLDALVEERPGVGRKLKGREHVAGRWMTPCAKMLKIGYDVSAR